MTISATAAGPGKQRLRIEAGTSADAAPRARALEASTSLLADQWLQARNLNALLESLLSESRSQLAQADEFERMLDVDSAEGFWLDRIGERIGLPRPSVVDTSRDFGFDDAGLAFDQGRLADDGPVQPRVPVGDTLYRRLVKARGYAVLGFSSMPYFRAAARHIDPASISTDLDSMAVRVTTSRAADMRLADSVGALPRPAGVRLEIRDAGLFGFDDSGVSFDLGRMA